LALLRHLPELKSLGYPLLVGTSRKSFIGQILGGLPPEERLEGTLATLALAVAWGADAVRVHDVKEAVRAVRVADALIRGVQNAV
jgi:dihydropteroate synthase